MKFHLLLLTLAAGMAAPATLRAANPDPLSFFAGRTRSTGVFENRRGEPTKTVTTETWGRSIKGELRLEQTLSIAGQPLQHRSWKMHRIDARHFQATANDMVGPARGEMRGNTFSWSFILATKPGNPFRNVRMTQHMYFQPDGRTMVNRSIIRKWGFTVAGVTEQFRRL